jgi:hypothetical protein
VLLLVGLIVCLPSLDAVLNDSHVCCSFCCCREQYDRGSGRDRADRRDYDRRDSDRRGEYDRRAYDRRDRDGRDEPRRRSSRSRSRSPYGSRGGGGRDASDVFKERAGGAATDVRARYGDASGKVDLGPSGSTKRSADEVFRLGQRTYR